MTRLLDAWTRPGAVVLDAGAGSGFFSAYFLARGCRVYTVDYSDDALAMARQITGGQCEAYLHEDLLDPSFGARFRHRFAIIFTDGLFEHFPRAQQDLLMETFRTAKQPQGLIATFVPNRYSPWQLIRPYFMPGISEEPFTLDQLLHLHRGLEIVARGGLNTLPVCWSPDRWLGSRFGMILYCLAR